MRASARWTWRPCRCCRPSFDAAHIHGTEVRLAPVAVPVYWNGPTFTKDPEVASLLETLADRGRPLGQLSLA